eukprot:1157271-Pelagomonas_calceolata.AAC.22
MYATLVVASALKALYATVFHGHMCHTSSWASACSVAGQRWSSHTQSACNPPSLCECSTVQHNSAERTLKADMQEDLISNSARGSLKQMCLALLHKQNLGMNGHCLKGHGPIKTSLKTQPSIAQF